MKVSKAAILAFTVLLFFFISTICKAQGMGAFYWGDADGNGAIGTPDITSLKTVINNPLSDDSLLYTKYPVSRYRQDTDGNGAIGTPDLTILKAWLNSDYSTIGGGAATLLLEANTTHVNAGDSVVIGSHGLSGTSSAIRTGWGVEFQIDATSPCQTAEIYGYTVKGGDTTSGYGWYHQAYKYTPQPFAPDNGIAWVKVRPTGCATTGDHIYIKVFIPSDSQAAIPGHRFPNELDATILLDITVPPSGGCPFGTLASLAASPNPITLQELGTQQLRVVGTMTDSSTVDCTTTCACNATTYASTGDVSVSAVGLVTANHVAKCAGGSGTVIASNASNGGINSPVDNITVTNDESVAALAIAPASATIAELATVQLTATATLSDATTVGCNTGCCGTVTSWNAAGGVSVNSSGLVTGSAVTKCVAGAGTVTATNNGHTSNISNITVTNTETVSTMTIAPASASIAEAGTVQLNATAGLSDGSTAACNTSCCGNATSWNAAGAVTVNSSGLVTGSAVTKCVPGTGTVTATNSAHVSNTSTITVTNNESVSALAIAPASASIAELTTVQLNATATLSDASTVACNTRCCGTTTTWAAVGAVSVNSSGLVTGSAVTKCVNGAGTVTATNNAHVSNTSTITVTNTETVSSVTIAPASTSIAEAGTIQLNATASLSDGSTAACNTSCCGTATTWNAAGAVTVNASGLVTGSAVTKCVNGAGTVTATNSAHVSDTSTITVTNNETVSALAIAPTTATIAELITRPAQRPPQP